MATARNQTPAERGSADSVAVALWAVYRQDDNGNRFAVHSRLTHAEAVRIAAEMESHGHKQMYWVGRDSST